MKISNIDLANIIIKIFDEIKLNNPQVHPIN